MIKAKKFNSFEEYDWEIGSYVITPAEGRLGVLMTLPCGDRFMPDNKWQLTDMDDENKITLTPSIQCMGKIVDGKATNCWHGYLTEGQFRDA